MRNFIYLYSLHLKKLKLLIPVYCLVMGVLIFVNLKTGANFLALFQLISMMFLYQRTFDYLYFDKMEKFELYSNINTKLVYLTKYIFISTSILLLTIVPAIVFFILKIPAINNFILISAYTFNVINLAFLVADRFRPTYANYFFYALILISLFEKFTNYISLPFFEILYSKVYFLCPFVIILCVLYNLLRRNIKS